jgi:hypothetical protein
MFRGQDLSFETGSKENRIKNILLVSKEEQKLISIPVDGVVVEGGISGSKYNFSNLIKPEKKIKSLKYSISEKGIINTNSRYSLHIPSRYSHLFAAGSCTSIKNNIFPGMIRTDDVKTNYDIGLYAALNMCESKKYGVYSFTPISTFNILDKKLSIIGNDNPKFDSKIVYIDEDKERFISYLFTDNKLSGAVTFGFNTFDIYLKEAFNLGIVPEIDYVARNISNAHERIVMKVIKNSDMVTCKNINEIQSLKKNLNIEFTAYDPMDLAYNYELINRYKILENKLKMTVDQISKMNNEENNQSKSKDSKNE